MPNWLIVFLTAVVAGFIGFVIGALLPDTPSNSKNSDITRDISPDRVLEKSSDPVINRLKDSSNEQTIARAQKSKSKQELSLPIFAKSKNQVISHLESLGFSIGSELYMNQKGLTVFPLEGDASIRISWRMPDYEYVKEILISNTRIDHSPKGARPVLAAWEKIQPDMIPLFQQITLAQWFSARRRWYKNGPYAYGIAENNKYFITYIGPQSRIPILQKQHLECTILYIGWYNRLEETRVRLEKMTKPGISQDQFFEACKNEFNLLNIQFGNVHIYDMGEDFPIKDPKFFYGYIPPDYHDEAKSALLRAAGGVAYLVEVANRQCAQKKIGFPFMSELFTGLRPASFARDNIWGEYRLLEDYKSFSQLPKDLQKRLYDISVEQLARAISN